MNEEKELFLRDVYYSAAERNDFLTQQQLYDRVKDSDFSRPEIKHFLEQQDVYTKFKRMPGISKYRQTKVYDLADQIQIDLVILQKYRHENDGYQYILVAIELLSRTAFAQPMKLRDATHTRNALQNLFDDFHDRFNQYPKRVQYDEGPEFKNKIVNQFFKDKGVEHYFSTYSQKQAAIVERVNRTLQEKLKKKMILENNHEWVSHLHDVVESYNSSFHRSIQMKPSDVNQDNKFTVWGRLYGQAVEKIVQPKFQLNDQVRVYRFRLHHRATRGFRAYYNKKYANQRNNMRTPLEEEPLHFFSNELFHIREIKPLGPIIVYKLRSDEADENILGYFYEEELSRQRE